MAWRGVAPVTHVETREVHEDVALAERLPAGPGEDRDRMTWSYSASSLCFTQRKEKRLPGRPSSPKGDAGTTGAARPGGP